MVLLKVELMVPLTAEKRVPMTVLQMADCLVENWVQLRVVGLVKQMVVQKGKTSDEMLDETLVVQKVVHLVLRMDDLWVAWMEHQKAASWVVKMGVMKVA